jgi:hypothetical protein
MDFPCEAAVTLSGINSLVILLGGKRLSRIFPLCWSQTSNQVNNLIAAQEGIMPIK